MKNSVTMGLATDAALIEHCQASIAKGSKTFVFASKFFGAEKMRDAALLYQWCRHCDDAIDQTDPSSQPAELTRLRVLTLRAVHGDPLGEISFRALALLMVKHKIPAHYPLELIEGMAMDTRFAPPAHRAALELYCYRVAGVVGLMMAHVMGISDERALKNACDLGLAMQLTNVARDVLTDQKIGRCYIPLDLLARHGLTLADYYLPQNRAALALATREILSWADKYYMSGEAGIPFLSKRSALVILIARFTYARIGQKVIRAGAGAWDRRQFTSSFEKFLCFAKALICWSSHLVAREPWAPRPIAQVWRFP